MFSPSLDALFALASASSAALNQRMANGTITTCPWKSSSRHRRNFPDATGGKFVRASSNLAFCRWSRCLMTPSQSFGFGIPRHAGNRSLPSKINQSVLADVKMRAGNGNWPNCRSAALLCLFSGRFTQNRSKKDALGAF